jgi:hypothetical protein
MSLIMPLRAVLAVAALASAAWLACGSYPLGLDFQGGAAINLHVRSDAQRVIAAVRVVRPRAEVSVDRDRAHVMLADGDDDDVRAITTSIGADGEVQDTSVIPSGWPSWCARTLLCAIALVAAAAWLGALVWRRAWPFPVLGTLALVWTAAVVALLARGWTLTMPVEITGAMLAIAALPAARPSEARPLDRVVAAWPAGILLALVALGSLFVPRHVPRSLFPFALQFAPSALPVVVAVTAGCAIAAARGRAAQCDSSSIPIK